MLATIAILLSHSKQLSGDWLHVQSSSYDTNDEGISYYQQLANVYVNELYILSITTLTSALSEATSW